MPLISVIIPVYNGEKTIKETIKSILNQTFTDFELIVINDGSQDATLDIVSSINDTRIKIFSYANAGLAASRNRGFDRSSGEYISFIDADDLWMPDKLAAQFKALQENPKAILAYSWTNYIDSAGKFLLPGTHLSWSGDVYHKLFVINFIESGSNILICRQAFSESGGFDCGLKFVEDWDLWLRLAAKYQFVAVPFPHILYRISTNSMSANLLKMEAIYLQVIERAISRTPEIQYLKKASMTRLYKILISRAFICGIPDQKMSLAIAKLFWKYIINDPLLFNEIGFKAIVLLKIVTSLILSPKQSKGLLAIMKNIYARSSQQTKTD